VLRYVGLWDPDRDDAALLDACAAALERAGAPVRRLAADGGLVTRYRPLAPRGELVVRPARPRDAAGSGGLAQFTVDVDQVDAGGPRAWAALREALVRLAGDVRPLVLVCPVELGVDQLPEPPAEDAEEYFRTGWADLGRLPAWAGALGGVGDPVEGGGRWWSDDARLAGDAGPVADGRALSRRLYAAWVRAAQPPPAADRTVPPPLPPRPRVWFWDADRDEDALSDAVVDWSDGPEQAGLPARTVRIGNTGEPGWYPVELVPGADVPVAASLDMLRAAVAAVRPSWAALLPDAGFAVPGLDPAVPASGIVWNVWASTGWLGSERTARLRTALDGAHREEFAGGTLYVVQPGLVPGAHLAPWCADPPARTDHLVEAAAILAEAARAT
jgi:hypothetical protein